MISEQYYITTKKKNTYSAFLILKERRNQTREARAFKSMKNSKSVHPPSQE